MVSAGYTAFYGSIIQKANSMTNMELHHNAVASDRLFFTIFIAIILHTTLILGVGFSLLETTSSSKAIEVVLVPNAVESVPEKADFISQENQAGSGEAKEKLIPTTTEQVNYTNQQIQQTQPVYQESSIAKNATASSTILTTKNSSVSIKQQLESEEQVKPDESVSTDFSQLRKKLSLASIDLKLDLVDQIKTHDTRTYKINSISALKAEDAYYVTQWVKKIHRIGKLNYPEEARKRKIYGKLRLTVTMLADGTVKNIQIQRSSGHKILDDAAMRIVRLASPFTPFPAQLRRKYDVLEITRTWVFSKHSKALTQ